MASLRFVALMVLSVFITLPAQGQTKSPADDQASSSIAAQYGAAADRIISATLAGNDAYDKLEELCTTIGHRLSGSPQLERAINWAVTRLKRDGQENVHREPVTVSRWVRGRESATMLQPRVEPLHMLGLGRSVGTPPEGITASVVVVADEDALNALGGGAAGKIVLFNKIMPEYDPEHGAGYGKTVYYRTHGARLAAAQGAVASLVRSVTARSLRSPHTGAMNYGDAPVKIPAAAISTEDAELIARLSRRGFPVVVNLRMEANTLPDAKSANVIAELRGTSRPEEVIVIGGHIDSWDVGQGAHDDGGGCVTAMEAIHVLRRLKMIPKRTIRVVLWTNEENGLAGGKGYAAAHADKLDKHVAAIEMDSGVFQPTGYSVECNDKKHEALAATQLGAIVRLLASIGPMNVKVGGSGADVSPMKSSGVILMGHRVQGDRYFNYHHTHADTIDKIDPEVLSQNVAALATVAFILADMPKRLGSTEVSPDL